MQSPILMKISNCTKCNISKYCKHKVLPTAKLNKVGIDVIFIGEAPGTSEYINKEPFIGPAGECLKDILKEALHPETSYLITNSIFCTPWVDGKLSDIRAPTNKEIYNCTENLERIINKCKPKRYIALGRKAEVAIKRIDKNLPYLYILHPSKIQQARNQQYEFDRAVLQIKQYLGYLES